MVVMKKNPLCGPSFETGLIIGFQGNKSMHFREVLDPDWMTAKNPRLDSMFRENNPLTPFMVSSLE
jgi:hypothetical protein